MNASDSTLGQKERESDVQRLIVKAQGGLEARKRVWSQLVTVIEQNTENSFVQKILREIEGASDVDQLREDLTSVGINGFIPTDSVITLFSTLSQQRERIQDALLQAQTEDETHVPLHLLGILEKVDGPLRTFAAGALLHGKPEQKEVIADMKTAKEAEKAIQVLRKIFRQPIANLLNKPSAMPEEDDETSEPLDARSAIQCLLEAEEDLDRVQTDLDTTAKRTALSRKLAEKLRMNMHIFENSDSGLQLHMNQLDAIKALAKFLKNPEINEAKGYFREPTGAGKTVLFGAIIRMMDVKTLILVPKTYLLKQTADELTEVVGINKDKIGFVGGKHMQNGHKITIATYQSHISRMNEDPAYRKMAQECELIICDEAHRSLGEKTQESLEYIDGEFAEDLSEDEEVAENEVLENIEELTGKHSLRLGFSATPALVNKSVETFFKNLIHKSSYGELVKARVLKKFKVRQTDIPFVAEEIENKITSEEEIRLLRKKNVYSQLLNDFVEARKTVEEKLNTLVICSSIAECDEFARLASENFGLKSRIVTNREYSHKRKEDHTKQAEMEMLTGVIDFIISVEKLKEGWNFRPLNAVILARATLSPANILQPAGRAARAHEGQKFAYIFEGKWRQEHEDLFQSDSDGDKGGGSSGGSRSARTFSFNNKPISFADALYLSGEKDIKSVCEAWDGSKLSHSRFPTLDNNGEIIIEDIVHIGLNKYAVKLNMTEEVLTRLILNSDLTPNGKASSKGQIVDIYPKNEVDQILESSGVLNITNNEGCIDVAEITYVSLRKFCNFHNLSYLLVKKEAKSKLKSTTYGLSGVHKVELYKKDDVLALESVKAGGFEAGKKDTILIEGKICIALRKFCERRNLVQSTLVKDITEAGLKPISKVVAAHGMDEAYELSALEELPYVKRIRTEIPESGELLINTKEMGDITCIAPRLFAIANGIRPSILQEKIHEAGIKPVGSAAINKTGFPSNLYPKSEVLKISFVIQKLFKPNEKGEYTIENEIFIGIGDCAKLFSLNYKELDIAAEESDLQFKYKARRGNVDVLLYKKLELETLPLVIENSRFIDEKGYAVLQGKECVSLKKFADYNNLDYSTLYDQVKEAKLVIVGRARSTNVRVNMYEKAKILDLPYVKKRLGS